MHKKSTGQYPSASKWGTAAFVLANVAVVFTLFLWIIFIGLILGYNNDTCNSIVYSSYEGRYRKFYAAGGRNSHFGPCRVFTSLSRYRVHKQWCFYGLPVISTPLFGTLTYKCRSPVIGAGFFLVPATHSQAPMHIW
jgi:hypothetical protein